MLCQGLLKKLQKNIGVLGLEGEKEIGAVEGEALDWREGEEGKRTGLGRKKKGKETAFGYVYCLIYRLKQFSLNRPHWADSVIESPCPRVCLRHQVQFC